VLDYAQSVQVREEMRKQRIRNRSVDSNFSTSQSAFQDPADQWEGYIERCGHVNGKWDTNRRVNSAEARSRAHKTADRIFASADSAAPSAADSTFVDSHGQWVGEEVEAKLRGSAGVSSSSLWQSRDDMAVELKRKSGQAKTALRAIDNTIAAFTSGQSDGVYHLENLQTNGSADAAGMASKRLTSQRREIHGLLASDAPRPSTPPVLSGRPPLVDTNARVAGLTSAEMFENATKIHPRAPVRATDSGHASPIAGRSSCSLAADSAELHIDAVSKQGSAAQSDSCHQGSPRGRSPSMARRHGSPLLGVGERSDASPSRRSIRRQAPASAERSAPLFDSDRADASSGQLAESRQQQPSPARPASPSKCHRASSLLVATADVEPYAGQRSSAPRKPASAWEANHLWSEVRRAPRASGAKPNDAGGAGLSSSQLAAASTTLKYEQPPRRGPVAAQGAPEPSMSESSVAPAAAPAERASAPMASEGVVASEAAGRSSEAIGASTPTLKMEARPKPLSEVAAHEVQQARRSPVARLDLSALNKASSSADRVSPRWRQPASLCKAFSGAAGLSSEQSGVQQGQQCGVVSDTPPKQRPVSKTWQGSTTGVASTVFGAATETAPTRGSVERIAPGPLLSGRHGLASKSIANNRLASKTGQEAEGQHGAGGGCRRSASEPRRRPGSAGESCKDLIYGNVFDCATAEPPRRGERFCSPSLLRNVAGVATAAVCAGGRRMSSAASSAIGSSLGDFMGGGGDCGWRSASPRSATPPPFWRAAGARSNAASYTGMTTSMAPTSPHP